MKLNRQVMKEIKYLEFKDFDEIYQWFKQNHSSQKEMFCVVKRQKVEKCIGVLSYYDAVNAALCFGWIDSTLRNINGVLVQRFSPRRKGSHWTELNIERCKELYKKGLMDESGIKTCPVSLK